MPCIKYRRLNQVFWVLVFGVCLSLSVSAGPGKAKYIFLMIGDGLGSTQRVVAELYKRLSLKVDRHDPAGKLVMNRLPVVGMTATSSRNRLVTDSAAAATALACGEKTLNGVVSMASDKVRKLKAVSYDAQAKGMKVGIVSSVPLDHATPACFYATAPTRGNYYDIAMQIAPSQFNYFAGHYLKGTARAGTRPKPLVKAQAAGYQIIKDIPGFEALKAGDDKVIVQVDIKYKIDQTEHCLSLAELVNKGIVLLDNPKGFFMMVEGGKIDWSGHANDIATNIKEVLAFDDAVAAAYEFYTKHPEETLIVVTGDHETGGLKTSLTGNFKPETMVCTVKKQNVSGASLGWRANKWREQKLAPQEAMKIITDNFCLHNLHKREKMELATAIDFTLTLAPHDKRAVEYQKMYGRNNPAINAALAIIARRCGVIWTSFSHTGVAVKTTAVGFNAEAFAGQTDNTDIAKKLRAMFLRNK